MKENSWRRVGYLPGRIGPSGASVPAGEMRSGRVVRTRSREVVCQFSGMDLFPHTCKLLLITTIIIIFTS